jgi:NAD(P)-dependent dehydrogenase (short-subunit alcohol dehydrogenase family)
MSELEKTHLPGRGPNYVATQARRYEGRVALVTGGARGLGRVIARRLAEEGASVVIADIDEAGAARAAERLARETGQRFLSSGGDLALEGVADGIVERTISEFGQLDTLVNNAAALIRMPLECFTEELMQMAINWNIWNTLRTSKAVVPHMTERGYGRIVNIGGEAWRTGSPFHTLLGGFGKGGMVGFTATLAGETVCSGITVNCVSPGGINSADDGDPDKPSLARDPSWTPPDVLEALASMRASPTSIGRVAHPTEVAAAVAFFGSPEASYVTGQHLGVSGGLVMV